MTSPNSSFPFSTLPTPLLQIHVPVSPLFFKVMILQIIWKFHTIHFDNVCSSFPKSSQIYSNLSIHPTLSLTFFSLKPPEFDCTVQILLIVGPSPTATLHLFHLDIH